MLLLPIKKSSLRILLMTLSLQTVNESYAINPSCQCVRFSSTYGKERGIFSSPDYPRTYPANIDCLLYAFVAKTNNIVELLFTDLDIFKGHLDCTRGDYLKVYSEIGNHGPGPPGLNEYSSWSRVLCGSRADVPSAIYSSGPQLILEFHTGMKTTNSTGFIGTYKFIERRNFETDGVKIPNTWCDYVFNSHPNQPSYGRLYSPRYPSNYPSNVRCTYHFNAGPNERIKIVFDEIFFHKGDESCLNQPDIIKVFDGKLTTDPVLAILCNEVIGYEIFSTGSVLLVQFTANSDYPGQGFKANYQYQINDNKYTDKERLNTTETLILGPAVSATTSSCHQVFNSDKSRSGKLSSPLYPRPYPPKTECHFEFLARGRQRIRLIFEDFNLQKFSEQLTDCESMDSLDIFLYIDGRLEKMASFCGSNIPKPIMSNGPKLSVVFRGLYSSRHCRGFTISYSFVEDYGITSGRQLLEFPCAFVYNSSHNVNGVVMSPNYPGLYPRQTECNYFFYAEKNERIYLSFTYFDIEGVIPCKAISESDYVEIHNQMIDKGSQRYCGHLKELRYVSTKSFLRLTFKSNDRLDGRGFIANYKFLHQSEKHSIIVPKNKYNGSHHLMKKTMLLIVFVNIILICHVNKWFIFWS